MKHPLIKRKIFNKVNLGCTGAMNQFFDILPKDHKLWAKVDNDTVVPKGWLDDLSTVLESEDLGAVQAKHFFLMEKVVDWEDLVSKRESKKVFDYDLVYSNEIGGSAIVARRDMITEELDESENLVGWTKAQRGKKDAKFAFYGGVFVDLLDMAGYNKFDIQDMTYAIQTGRIDARSFPNVSIIIPVIREERVKQCIAAIEKNIILGADKYEIITDYDDSRVGCPKMVKRLVDRTKYDLVMFLGDDTEPEEGFMVEALSAMNKLPDSWGLVGLNDGIQDGERLATHWLAHKNLLDHLPEREFFFTGYIHQFCDAELMDTAKDLGRYIWADRAKLKHNHPIVNLEFEDADYRRVYSNENRNKDHKMYIQRKKAKGYSKIGIGFPLTDDKIYTTFFLSWILMDKPNFTLLMPQAPGPIETIRNNLVVQALRDNCTRLIMMDTDQNYPADTIQKLLSHDKDVVSVNVHRRYPPFDSIMLRGELGAYSHVPDEECFSGELIRIDATGCGCVSFNTEVFLDIPYPWFQQGRLRDGRTVGEDIDFCNKLSKAGYELWADTSIKVGHISVMEITSDFYLLYKKIKGFDWRPPPEELLEANP